MKIADIISEGSKTALTQSSSKAIPDLETFSDLDNNNNPYLAYRFGLIMAGAPEVTITTQGPIGSQFTTIGYSTGEAEIIDAAKRIMGVKSVRQTPKGSQETDDTNKQSLVVARDPVKLKKRK